MLNIIRPTSLLYSVIWKIILDYRAIETGTNRPWNETSKERIVQGTKRPGNETSKICVSFLGAKCLGNEKSSHHITR